MNGTDETSSTAPNADEARPEDLPSESEGAVAEKGNSQESPPRPSTLALAITAVILTAISVAPAFVAVADRLFQDPPIPPERLRIVVWGFLAGYGGLVATLLFGLWHLGRVIVALAKKKPLSWATPVIAILPFTIVAVIHDQRDTLSWHLLELGLEAWQK